MSYPTPTNRTAKLMQTERIYLRPFDITDVDAYYPSLFEPEMRKLTGTQASFIRSQVEKYVENLAQDDSRLNLLIALQSTDEIIGDVALMDMHAKNRSAHIRIAIDQPAHQGKGYGSEASRLCSITGSASPICIGLSWMSLLLTNAPFARMKSSASSVKA